MKNNPDYKWKGMVYGLVVLAILTPLMPPPIQEEISSAAAGGRLPLAILLFAIVFSIFGLVMQAVTTRLLKFKVQAVG